MPHKYSSSSDYREEIAKTETRLSLVRTCMTHKLGNSCQDSSPPSSSDILGKPVYTKWWYQYQKVTKKY